MIWKNLISSPSVWKILPVCTVRKPAFLNASGCDVHSECVCEPERAETAPVDATRALTLPPFSEQAGFKYVQCVQFASCVQSEQHYWVMRVTLTTC